MPSMGAIVPEIEIYLTQPGVSHKVLSISEDATDIIARIDYDSESDRLVGFVYHTMIRYCQG